MTIWGKTKTGHDVQAVTLDAHGMQATILNYGAILQDLRLDGIAYSLTRGSDTLSDYEADMCYHGAIVGPVANRLSKGEAVVGEERHVLKRPGGSANLLHGGDFGTHTKIWNIDEVGPEAAILSLDFANGSDGLPGNRGLTAKFEICAGPTLRLTLTTESDKLTVANLTNHSYWNLDGTATMTEHRLQIDADQHLEVDSDTVPTGNRLDVAETPYDFRSPQRVQPGSPPLDTTYCIAEKPRELTECLTLTGQSGLTMKLATTEPGILIYDGRPAYDSLAIEAQGWPDAPNNPHFPSVEVRPDEPMVQVTEWRFSR